MRHLSQWLIFGTAFRAICTAYLAPNYRPLIGHQVWALEGEVSEAVVHQLEVDGLIDVLQQSRPTKIRVMPDLLDHVGSVLKKARVSHQVLVTDLADYLQKEEDEEEEKRTLRRDDSTRAQNCISGDCPAPITDTYMTFEQMEYYLTQLAQNNPRVKLTSIGKSVEGRDIWMVHIKPGNSSRGTKSSRRRKAIWIEGGIHAREWISPAVALQLIHELAQELKVTRAFDIYVAPMANPDGYVFSWTGDRMWRKNRAETTNPSCPGVDLNRNWDYKWGVRASANPCSEVYKGPEAFSEPETRALRNAMLKKKRRKVLVIALHSYGQVLLHPWGWSRRAKAPNTKAMKAKGKIFAAAAEASSGRVYTVEHVSSAFSYLASGATDDWAKKRLKSKFVYTLELPNKNTFQLPANEILPTGKEVWAGLLKLMEVIARK